ncbi:MAG: PilZ domain-containing protein [Proteobacteria bacterium]|nr:PilZ domain-containing protein [Pseudomonadota bacterium]
MTDYSSDRRRHRRFTVNQPCRLTIGRSFFRGQGDVKGLITNISKGGAAVRFGLQMAKPPPVGTPVNIYIGGVGDFPCKVMRCYADGFAVAFKPRKTWDKQLIEKLDRLLPEDDDEA